MTPQMMPAMAMPLPPPSPLPLLRLARSWRSPRGKGSALSAVSVPAWREGVGPWTID